MSSVSNKTKNDINWEKLFDKYNILNKIDEIGCFEILASQINEFREARLMTKFDHSINLPEMFKKNSLAILPITRGSYIISRFDAYKKFEIIDNTIIKASFPDFIKSIDYENISTEATAINCAYVSNIISDFLKDGDILPTVSGRMSSDAFSFEIASSVNNSTIPIKVTNSQIEIDGAFEGLEYLSIIEAKNYYSEDFLIRQLYYPFRLWSKKISKVIRPIFLIFSNGIFTLFEYSFTNHKNYNSLVLVRQKNYSIESTDISLNELINISKQTKVVGEERIPFPQADNFKRVISLCESLATENMTREDISIRYAFDQRQADYYTTAGRYLGLIEKKLQNRVAIYSLSKKGRRIISSKYRQRQFMFVEAILKHRVFFEIFKIRLNHGEMPSINEVVKIMKQCGLYNIDSEKTFRRRASTITGWINWILGLHE